jgi:peptidoglycan/LPS O-acetylase OafA/YrhL
MIRDRVLKVLLVLVGLVLIGGIYPLATSLFHTMNSQVSPGDQMILGIYFPIGIFLLLAARNPAENRSLILCFAWSTLAHMGVMFVQAVQAHSLREDLPALLVISVVCVALLVLTPAMRPPPRALEAPA